MDAKVMKQRLKQWMPIFQEQAKSGLGKDQWCRENGIRRWEFYQRQKECREYLIETSGSEQVLPVVPESLPEFFELPAAVNPDHDLFPVQCKDSENQDGHIVIKYDSFDISLTGAINPDTLTTLIKAVRHA